MKKDTEDEINIRGAVLLTTISFYIPALSQIGTRTIPPPIAAVPLSTPAMKPFNIA